MKQKDTGNIITAGNGATFDKGETNLSMLLKGEYLLNKNRIAYEICMINNDDSVVKIQ